MTGGGLAARRGGEEAGGAVCGAFGDRSGAVLACCRIVTAPRRRLGVPRNSILINSKTGNR